ncbi:zinc-binding alcohol dehydrogenase family protein [Novosphingobium rosa]|uniref:zinc-binding alcohol dehydrogenase family protein n=1 Tax=Novosphingobium rosa TaxID=76978 RepID=UPI000835B4FE|nr:zinc-binding alcohol dehydrogenase family protein [Novosphingobium rosa]
MPNNTALWLPAKRATALKVGPAPYTAPKAGEIVVRVHAVAVNPMDRLMQTVGDLITPYLAYPFVLGSDVAGEVVEIGEGVTRFRLGERVLGHAVGSDKARNHAAEGAFQTHAVLLAHMAAPMPEDMPFEAAAVLPLALSTAACGLFQQDQLALDPPSLAPRRNGKWVLIWGASTSVGCNAVQLAVAAGYQVVATASPANFDYVKSLGASLVFDYRSNSVVADIVAALRGHEVAGALAIGLGSATASVAILGQCQGKRFVAMATPPASFDAVPAGQGRIWRLAPVLMRMVAGSISLALKAQRRGVRTAMIWGSSLLGNEVGPMIYEAFLPEALASGRYVAAPAPLVVGHGLTHIVQALERQRRGVSACKLVVTL